MEKILLFYNCCILNYMDTCNNKVHPRAGHAEGDCYELYPHR